MRGPGFVNLDFGVSRNFAIGERFRIDLRAESFNLMNPSSLFVFPLLDLSSFPRTDVGQFVISVKAFWGRN